MKLPLFVAIWRVIQNILVVSLILNLNLRGINVSLKQETDLRMQNFLSDVILLVCLF